MDSRTSDGGFIVNGNIIANGGTIDIKNVNAMDMQHNANIVVQNGGILNISGVNRLIMTSTNNAPTLKNDGGIINIDTSLYNYNKQEGSYTRPNNGGYILQNSGTTTITGSLYNAGFDNVVSNGARKDALIEIKGGIFEVKGDFENGNHDSSRYYDYFGQGTLNASGDSEVIVRNDFISDAQGEDLAGGGVLYRSSVNLSDNAILRVGNSFKAYRSDISLTDLSSIYTKDFFLDTTANIKFIGGGSGFGSINASNSATFNGGVEFKLANPLMQTDNKTYLILDTPSLNGTSLQEGKVEVIGSSGGTINNAEIVKVGDKYYLSFNGAIPPIDPDIGGGDGSGGSGGDSGNEGSDSGNGGSDGGNTGGGGETGGDSGDSENGGNQGSGDLGGGSESGGDNPQKPNRPTSNNPVYNAIYEALVGKGGIIDDEATLHKATQTIEKQLDHIKEGPKSYQGSVMHHNMLGRIAHTTRTQYALNSQQKYASIAGDYVRMPYFEKEETQNNVYVNVLAGYSHYKDSDTSDYGINFGYDKEIKDSFFGGIYGSVSKRNMKAENMDLDGYNYNIGLYGRSHLTKAVELDMLGYYTNSQSEYTRTFAGIGNNTASYDTHNIGFQARLGYRVKFENGHSLKPYIGFFGSYYHMPQYKENGNVLPITRSENDFMNLYGAVGVEYRKINENGGSFFVAIEGVQGKPVFGDKDYEVRMGVSRIKYENEEEFFGSVFAGANLPISENWDLSATVMAQAYDNGLTSVSGSVGLRYAF
ncbi:outer membrane autotransporter barrel domain protein [Helicobacter pullorum MIT 98-5489]|uniref:Outer membrane autotransporter barrel domain protein n=2 Tax=Helicobacter pullorum TaxID=35818 RepID=C5EZL0_9HELI|nr:autotransporter outer membrane beta-barrel domain-containing protein [Helicobacter pullorum]EEQ63454.1 outer membrane autotransporter barrel domain protein [Helicobacter pullorum MIT 98-5489]